MEQCFVALGSNLGDSAGLLRTALLHLRQSPFVDQLQISRLYRTAAIAQTPQGDYLNAVCSFHCTLAPYELLHLLQEIERAAGQESKCKDAPRYLDLDILFFGEQQIDDTLLQIPHPRWRERLFVLAPLFDLHPSEEIAALMAQHEAQRCEVIAWEPHCHPIRV